MSTVNAQFGTDRLGNPNSALYLNDGYLTLPPNIYFNATDGFTISLWFKYVTTKKWQAIIDILSDNNIEGFFMHSDEWGQYGEGSDSRPYVAEFVYGYTDVTPNTI